MHPDLDRQAGDSDDKYKTNELRATDEILKRLQGGG
jgi:hypothetical protein